MVDHGLVQTKKKIIVLHQGQPDYQPAQSSWKIKDLIISSINSLGYNTTSLFVDEEFKWVDTLQDCKNQEEVVLVFNAADLGLFYNIGFESHIPTILEAVQIPFTGSRGITLANCIDKYNTKILAREEGIPVPTIYLLSKALDNLGTLHYPFILKPRSSYGSKGINIDSVVRYEKELQIQAGKLEQQKELFSAWIVEEYLEEGEYPEITCGFVGNKSRLFLPPIGFEFSGWYDGKPRIRDYASKFSPESGQYGQCAAKSVVLNRQLQERLEYLTNTIADLFEVQDYGRFDFRLRRTDNGLEPCLIDINANPDLNDDASLFFMSKAYGRDYNFLIERIVDAARERYEK